MKKPYEDLKNYILKSQKNKKSLTKKQPVVTEELPKKEVHEAPKPPKDGMPFELLEPGAPIHGETQKRSK